MAGARALQYANRVPGVARQIRKVKVLEHTSPARGRNIHSRAGVSRTLLAVVLLLLVLCAAAVRAYRLDRLSFWGDEYWGCVAGLGAPTAAEYWDFVQLLGTNQPPLFPMLMYGWARLIGSTDLAPLRLLPLLFGLLTTPVAFGIGARVYGRRAGVFAAGCVAFSIMHIWYSQSVRPYALMLLLACVSLYALLRVLDHGSRLWAAVALAANLLGVFTHWFLVLLIGIESLALFLFRPGGRWRAVAWTALHALWLVPLAAYLMSRPPMNVDFENSLELWHVRDALLVEAVSDYRPTLPQRLVDDGSPRGRILAGAHAVLSTGTEILSAIALLWLAVEVLRIPRARRAGDAAQVRRGRLASVLLLVAVTPVAALALLQYALHLPFLWPRYTLYGSVARYVAIGGWIGGMRARTARWSLYGAAALCLGYQLVLFLPAVTRTDYLGVRDCLRAIAGPEDIILTDGYASACNLLYHLGPCDPPLFFANSPQVVCDVCVWRLGQCREGKGDTRRGGTVWFVRNQNWMQGRLWDFERELMDHGLIPHCREFPGTEGLILYEITCGLACDVTYQDIVPPIPAPEPVEVLDFLELVLANPAQVGLTSLDVRERALRLAGTNPVVIDNPVDTIIMMLLAAGDIRLGDTSARLWAEYEATPEAAFLSGLARAVAGDLADAGEAFGRALAGRSSPVVKPCGPFAAALRRGDYAAAYTAAERLRRSGHPWGVKLRETVRRLRSPESCLLPLGVLPVDGGDYERLARDFAAPPKCTGWHARANHAISEVLNIMGRTDEALDFARRAAHNQLVESYARARLRDLEMRGSAPAPPGT